MKRKAKNDPVEVKPKYRVMFKRVEGGEPDKLPIAHEFCDRKEDAITACKVLAVNGGG